MTPKLLAILECPICHSQTKRPLPLELHDNYRCVACELDGNYSVFLEVVSFKEAIER